MEITVEIPGDAVPQPRARSTRNGRHYTPDNGIVALKAAVALLVTAEARRLRIACSESAAFGFDATCVFARPPSHLSASGDLRASAPAWPGMRAGDWDNLAKGLADGVTGSRAIWHDDTQVVDGRCRKRYAARGEPPRTILRIWSLPP